MSGIDQDAGGDGRVQVHMRIKGETDLRARRVLGQMNEKGIGLGSTRPALFERCIELGLEELVRRTGVAG